MKPKTRVESTVASAYDRLQGWHAWTFKENPTDTQLDLYKEFPDFKGFLEDEQNPEKLRAVFVVCLYQLFVDNAQSERVYLVVPPKIKSWVEDELREYFRSLLKHLPVDKREQYLQRIKLFGFMYRVHQEPEELKRWAAYGFTSSDLLPAWLRGKLL